MKLKEGQFLITDDDHIFEVKGIVHPSDRVVSFLRYAKCPQESSRKGYRKIYNLQSRFLYLKKHHPEYLWKDPVNDRVMQAVPMNKIKQVLDPVECLETIRKNKIDQDNIRKTALELAIQLVKQSGISWKVIGITGSILAHLDGPNSDIDFVIYGENPVRAVHSTLCHTDREIDMKPYENALLANHVHIRWGEQPEYIKKILYKIEKSKKFQGMFQGYEVFIRGVRQPCETIYKYGDKLIERKFRIAIKCKVIHDTESLFTPCEYIVRTKRFPKLTKLVSFRGKFTEHVKKTR